ncbi:MAG TPA: hypothetical protein VEP90_00525 [Methylomirabilota bacterium]|nr:hypothetical protein [Methylomirabilota bacterium]
MIDNKKQWYILILVTLWLLTALISPIVAFCLTRSPLTLTLFGTMIPPSYIFSCITRHIFPMDDRDYKLAEIKAKCTADRANKKGIFPNQP